MVNCLLHMMTCACGDILCDILLASQISCGCGSVDILYNDLLLYHLYGEVITKSVLIIPITKSLSLNLNHLGGSILNDSVG